MSIVLIFGNRKVSCISLEVKGKEIIVKDSALNNNVENFSKVLGSVDETKNLLQSVFGSSIKEACEHKLYYAFSCGSGLVYKTWQSAPSSFVDITDKTSEEKEERVLSLALENIPEGFVDLYKDARVSIVNCYEDDNLFTVTSAYVPAMYVDNLLEASEALGFNVFGISDIASSLYKLIDCSSGQYLVQADEITVVVNQCGCLPIILPGGYGDAIADIVYGMTEKFYPVKDSRSVSRIVSVSDPNIAAYLKIPLYGTDKQNIEAAVIAAGCITDDKLLLKADTADKTNIVEIKEGGGKGSVTSKLRKLFKKK